VESAPVTLTDGGLDLRILVDESSMEVYTGEGTRALTAQIFPDQSSSGVDVFAEGGVARISGLHITQLGSIWP
jgi:levanase